jgi:hypothetical protein
MPLNNQLCLVAGSSCWATKHCGSTALDNLVALASYLVHIIPSVHMPFRAPWKGESWWDQISTFLFQHSPLNHNLKKKKVCTQSLCSKELLDVYMHGNSHYTYTYISETRARAHTHTHLYSISAQLLLITIATRYVKCLALALTSGTLFGKRLWPHPPSVICFSVKII